MVKKIEKFKSEELNKYKKELLAKKEKILSDLIGLEKDTFSKSQKDASGDLSGYSLHMADVATDNFDREFAMGLASNEQKALSEVDEALKRIKDKSFGLCQECGKRINQKRLKVVPFTRFCVGCQSVSEKK